MALVLAMFAKPQFQLAISFLFKTPASKLTILRKNLDTVLKILVVGGAIVVLFV